MVSAENVISYFNSSFGVELEERNPDVNAPNQIQ